MKTPLNSLSPIAAFLARHSAIIALAVFAIVGVFVLDDYGVSVDDGFQRRIGSASFDYILGDETALTEGHHRRFYGVAFVIPLIAVERLLGLEDSRDVHVSRRLLTHLLFLAAGFSAWLLTYRLFESRLVAMLAMLIFLLHPRMYAHSFFNTKDLPFLSVFMIALYLIHRAFRRDSVWAFALCGAGVGLLANIRIMGLMLIPAVLGMLALDVFYAMKRGGGVKHILANICAFSAAFAATLYAAWPLLWRDPTLILEALDTLSRHPFHYANLFRGEPVQWPNLPWEYIPTWMLITTPPVALILAAIGIGCVARLCAADWRDALANSTARFGLLALACLILPVAAVIALNSNVFSGWRHVYFLYAPLCVLAAFGLRGLASLPKPSLRAGAFALAALGIAAAAVQMVRLHPLQSEYFNPLADKSDLANRWEMNYWRVSYKEAFDALLNIQPSGPVMAAAVVGYEWKIERDFQILPPDDRRRLSIDGEFPSFRVFAGAGGDFEYPVIWKREVYGVPVAAILDVRADTEAAFQDAYTSALAPEQAASAGGFDIYADGGRLVYINEDCGEEVARSRFALSVFPVDQSDLPQTARDAGLEYEPLDFDFQRYGARLDGKCFIVRNLPYYAISRVETARLAPDESRLWSVQIPIGGRRERYERALASLSGDPAASAGGFDIYADGGRLVYINEDCGEEVARSRFALSVFPVDQSVLPQTARDAGLEYEPLDFDFRRYGARLDGKCFIVRNLPYYAISRVETAQLAPDESRLWSVQIPIGGRRERYERALASLSGDPAASAGGFDIYADGGRLVYITNEDCGEEYARDYFALFAFPVDQSVLSARARDAGLEYEQFDFAFQRYGARLDGKCVIVRRLPDYAISHVETGQFTPGESRLWSVRIPLGGYRERHERALSSLSGEPAARSGFDLWLNGGALTYVKENCAEDDTRGRFFLSVFPSDPSDLPQTARDAGREHESLNFDFDRYGAIVDGNCSIIRYLPAYPISRVETGQWIPDEGELWKARIEEERRESSE